MAHCFFDELMFCRTSEDIDKALKEMSKGGEVMPMLMLLYRGVRV